MIKVAIITISDSSFTGERKDKSGRLISEMIEQIDGQEVYYQIIPDEISEIKKEIIKICDKKLADLIITTGGTGFAPRDVTPEATLEVIEKEVPGIAEMMRRETSRITPLAALSRARSGIRGSTLVVNLPGKPRAVRECLETIIDIIPHGIQVLKGEITQH